MFRKRPNESHKGDFGRVLIIGGSKDYVGAVTLAGLACYATGVDVVVIAAPEKVAWAVNCKEPDFITKKFEGDYFQLKHANEVIELAEDSDAVLIGPGLGLKSEEFVKKVIKNIKKPKVIDADAIKAITPKDVKNAIITPHLKEFEIFYRKLPKDIKEKARIVKKIVNDNVILLKGNVDLIVSKDKIKYNKTGNAGMTVAGTGDVLAGLCLGFLVQTRNLFKSAYYAAYINGKIGNYLYRKKSYSFKASDFIDLIPRFLR